MLYLFFDELSFHLLHVCYSDVEYDEFLDSEFYCFYEQTYGSDFVCYRVPERELFKFVRDHNFCKGLFLCLFM